MKLQTHSQSNAKLSRRTLLLARVGWIVLVLLMGSAFVMGLPLTVAKLSSPCDGDVTLCAPVQVMPELAATLEQQFGLSLRTYALLFAGYEVVRVLVYVATSAVILLRRSHDWIALVVSMTLVLFGMIGVSLSLAKSDALPLLSLPINLLQGFGVALFVMLFYMFPNGQFVPRWTRWLALGLTVFVVGMAATPLAFGQAYTTVLLAGAGIGLYAQIYRYRRVSGAVERQQSKWVVFGFVATAIGFMSDFLPFILFPAAIGSSLFTPAATIPGFALILYGSLVWYPLPITLAIAVMRFRLWDVDPIINRALVYTILTGLLALIYFGSVVLMQQVFRVEGQAQWVTVLSTLAIYALFAPLRRRVQNSIDRRFYRRKYDAQKVLEQFAATARDETDLEKLTARLVEVVQETMQPAHVSLWLRQATDVSRDSSHRNQGHNVGNNHSRTRVQYIHG